MTNKYIVKCKECSYVDGYSDTPVSPNPTCRNCGKQRMACELAPEEITRGLTFDILVSCQETNQISKGGFVMLEEDMKKDPITRANLFVDRAVKCCGQNIFTKDNVLKLLKDDRV